MLLKNLSTPENRAYWAFVEKTALECRADRRFHLTCHGCDACQMGDGIQTCAAVMSKAQKQQRHRMESEMNSSNAVVQMTLPVGTVITFGGLPVSLTQPATIELMEGNAEILKAELARRDLDAARADQ